MWGNARSADEARVPLTRAPEPVRRAAHHRIAFFVSIALAAVVITLPSSAAADAWIGDRYGWAWTIDEVRATTDGGLSWRLIFAGFEDIGDVTHTGPTTGVVTLESNLELTESFWTEDNRRHWMVMPTIRSPDRVEGHGRFLVSSRDGSLFRVRGWPPTGAAARCRGDFEPYDAFRGKICYEPVVPLEASS